MIWQHLWFLVHLMMQVLEFRRKEPHVSLRLDLVLHPFMASYPSPSISLLLLNLLPVCLLATLVVALLHRQIYRQIDKVQGGC